MERKVSRQGVSCIFEGDVLVAIIVKNRDNVIYLVEKASQEDIEHLIEGKPL